ncbi:manganese/zinc/iron transport system permease protein [Halospina denitrificans]|uniref:Manganese/zinc/iron transport system permease protein n=1 Tax=Halospina denitrificans TaxID=332522 RepID=A0A4R7JYV1_9GAMM|nr:metal ABC transporter permease [Halospina denitrificans]TDT43124.1 manganese/zinc/iron transport system permease protein [Halospina denitrificans]
MLELLGNFTVQTVVIGAVFLGIASGLLGCFAVLRQQSLMGDTLAHAALPGVCIGFLIAGSRHLGWIMAGALGTAVVAALFVQMVTRHSRIKTDAGLGIALSVSFALGVVLLTYIQGQSNASQGGLDSFLFGQAAATQREDLWFMGGVTLVALVLVMLCWKQFKLVTFDPLFAGSIGLPVVVLESVLTSMIALAVVVGLQMVGVVLMTAMVIAPAVAARQWVKQLHHMVILAVVFGIISGVIGVLISASVRHLATGPVVVLVISAIVAVSILLSPGRGVLWSWIHRQRERRTIGQRQMLTTMYKLAAHHDDPYYPVERSMLDSFYGVRTDAILKRLHNQGHVAPASHMPTEGIHWTLTDTGYSEAVRILQSIGAEPSP